MQNLIDAREIITQCVILLIGGLFGLLVRYIGKLVKSVAELNEKMSIALDRVAGHSEMLKDHYAMLKDLNARVLAQEIIRGGHKK